MGADLAVVFPSTRVSGGVERVAHDFLLYESGRRSVAFVGRTSVTPGVPVVRVSGPAGPSALAPLIFRRQASRTLRRLDAHTVVSMGVNAPPGDVLWVHSVHAAWLASGGDAYAFGRRVPSTARRALLRHQVLLRLERDYFTHNSARLILCTSQREIDDVATHYGVPRSLMHVVPNGFDPTLFSTARRERLRDEARRHIGAQDDDIVVLMVANEWHRKGLATLIEAVAATGDRRLRVDLVGSRSPDAYLPLAERLGLRDRLRWHGRSDDVAFYFAAADVFALPTTYEPFGLVIIEAMASGLPVVTSRLAGAADAITSGTDGILLDDPRDIAELAGALQAAAHPDLSAALAQAAVSAAAPFRRDQVMARVDSLIFSRPT